MNRWLRHADDKACKVLCTDTPAFIFGVVLFWVLLVGVMAL